MSVALEEDIARRFRTSHCIVRDWKFGCNGALEFHVYRGETFFRTSIVATRGVFQLFPTADRF